MKKKNTRIPARIVSGAQTGVDRAALDAAFMLNIPCGGFVPKGRMAEDGKVPEKYPVIETCTPEYSERTRINVEISDATLILNIGNLEGGTLYTYRCCLKTGKPVKVVDLKSCDAPETVLSFIAECSPRILNIAGPRESKRPGIYGETLSFLVKTLSRARGNF